jgi:hypothetical protein
MLQTTEFTDFDAYEDTPAFTAVWTSPLELRNAL